jgi:excisionase family DNA binding protein
MAAKRRRLGPAFHTVQELRQLLRIGNAQAYNLIANREVKAIKVGGSWRIPHSEFERLQRCEQVEAA